jgi:hypothetical protein
VDILDFILSNWWLLIPIIWFFSGAFGKKGKEQQERNGHPLPVANPIEVDEFRNDSTSADFPWERHQQPNVESATNHADFKKDSRPRRPEAIGGNEDRTRTQTPSLDIAAQDLTSRPMNSLSNVQYSKEEKKRLDFKSIDTTSVVQGMVWSQVFGKPRSKEPHRTSMYTRFGRKA